MYCHGVGTDKDLKEGVRLLRLAADQGYVEAQALLGYYHANGTGFQEPSLKLGIFWTLKAAKQNHALSQRNLSLYLTDLHHARRRPPPVAVYWMRKAAAQDPVTAKSDLIELEFIIDFDCANCGLRHGGGGTHKKRRCAKCRAVSYCSRDCQIIHWKKKVTRPPAAIWI